MSAANMVIQPGALDARHGKVLYLDDISVS